MAGSVRSVGAASGERSWRCSRTSGGSAGPSRPSEPESAWLSLSRAEGSRVAISPRGFQIMISTMAKPNSSMRYWVGSKSLPNTSLRKSSSRMISVPPIMMTAAIATPSRLPMPPSTTMATITADSMKVKLSGEMNPCRAAKNEPAKPANIAPMAKAVSLVLVVLMPSERQAISSSRNASQARPIGKRRSRRVTAAVSSASAEDQVVEKDGAVDRAEFEPEAGGEAVVGGVERNAEESRPRDAADAGIAVGHRHPVDQDEADDLAEGERDDGEIVAAQPQHRKSEQDAPERREAARERQQEPERQAEGLCQQRVGIGADRVEGDVAEIEQAGEPDHDVEAPAQHHVDQNLDAEIVDPLHRALKAGERERERRIDDREAERERDQPASEPRAPGRDRAVLRPRPHGAAREPGRDQERVEEAPDGDDRRPAPRAAASASPAPARCGCSGRC